MIQLNLKKILSLIVVLLVIGFASIVTVMFLNGKANIGFNQDDFVVYFSKAILDDEDKTDSIIGNNGIEITFETKKMINVGEYSKLDFDVTNGSTIYDAEVSIECLPNGETEHSSITTNFVKQIIGAQETVSGNTIITLIKSAVDDSAEKWVCSIKAKPIEREKKEEQFVLLTKYYVYGYLEENNEPIANKDLVIYSKSPKYVTTDSWGMFYVDGIIDEIHELYVLNDNVENIENLSKEEVISNSSKTIKFNVAGEIIEKSDENINIKNINTGEGSKKTYSVNLLSNGGIEENKIMLLIDGNKYENLPDNYDHSELIFGYWTAGDEVVTKDTVIKNDMDIKANYVEGKLKAGNKHFNKLEEALTYAKENNIENITFLTNYNVEDNILITSKIIMDINGLNVDFANHIITNENTLELKNGTIEFEGENNPIINQGILNIKDEIILKYTNTLEEPENIELNDTNRIIDNYGVVNFESGTLIPINAKAILTQSDGIFNVKGGIIDGTNAGEHNVVQGTTNSTIIIDALDKEVNIIGNNSNYYTLTNEGVLNIKSGTINFSNGFGIGSFGQINIGGEEEPIITGSGNTLITVRENAELTMISGTLKSIETRVLKINSNGIANIKGGTIDGTNATGVNTIYVEENGILNIDALDKEMNIIGNNSIYYSLQNNGITNIKSGTINFSNGVGIVNNGTLNIGGEEEPIITGSGDTLITVRENAELTMISGTLRSIETRILIVNSNGIANIKGGTIDGTTTTGVSTIYVRENGILNIDALDKEVNIIGNNSNYYTLTNEGILNIKSGTINFSNGFGIGSFGQINIGGEEEPIITGSGNTLIENRTNSTMTIISGILKSTNVKIIYLYSNAIANINGGTIDGTNATGFNSVYVSNGGILNIDADSKTVDFIGNGGSQYTIYSLGNVNIKSGTINFSNGAGIGNNGTLNIGGEKEPIITGVDKTLIENRTNSTMTIISGILKSTNVKIIYLYSNAIANINGGTIDGTNGTGTNAVYVSNGGILNIDADSKTVDFIGNGGSQYTIYSLGNVNIKSGTVNFSNGYGVGTSGTLNIGGEAAPTVVSLSGLLFTIQANGILTLKDGNIKSNNMQTVRILANGVMNINGGTIDGTTSTGYNTVDNRQDGTINIDADGNTVNIIGNGSTNYVVNNGGTLNVNSGTINLSNGPGIGNNGTMIVGGEKCPNIIGKDMTVIDVRDGTTMTMNCGTVKSINATAVTVYDSGTANINGGIIDSSEGGNFNAVIGRTNSIINIDAGSNELKFVGKSGNPYAICAYGTIKINSGILSFSDGGCIAIFGNGIIGTSSSGPTITGSLGSAPFEVQNGGTLTMNNGYLKSNRSNDVYIYSGGKFYMYGGTLENSNITDNYNKYNIYNLGTAIKYGGTSPSNYNVTIS